MLAVQHLSKSDIGNHIGRVGPKETDVGAYIMQDVNLTICIVMRDYLNGLGASLGCTRQVRLVQHDFYRENHTVKSGRNRTCVNDL